MFNAHPCVRTEMKTLVVLFALTSLAPAQKLIGWNNLGMHCMDDDYSVFSILPPYNTIDCQLIDSNGRLVKSNAGITLTYEAIADPDGSINRTSLGKTNFWVHSPSLFGASLPVDMGLPFPAGNPGRHMPGSANTPQFLDFSGVMNWFEAAGIPITPIDDNRRANSYPMMRLTAKTAAGAVLANTDIVLPVSGEMDCRKCHSSTSGPAARPAAGWVSDPLPSREYRLNILRLHDRHLGTQPYDSALAARGFPPEGLEASVRDHQHPVLCAACHESEALGASSFPGVKPLTESMHSLHANVISPENGQTLDATTNRGSCYQCHPGSQTRCLRGAMGAAVAADGSMAMQCQSCHGNMSQVGSPTRHGWLDEPTCQQCHTGTATQNNGQIRYTSVFDPVTGAPRVPASQLFATNADTPMTGKSLYRFSKGHGGLQCSACHGSTHAEFPASHRNDNLQSIRMQGHAGPLADCTACHASMPNTITGGPHGMHPTGTAWINTHKDNGNSASCLACHGADRRGTVLSRSFSDKTLTFTKDGVTRNIPLFRGETISCFICHKREDNGSLGGVFTNNTPPVVISTSLVTAANTPGNAMLNSSDANGNPRVTRIVGQPMHGSVSISGNTATYFPEQDFTGPDFFTFAAFDGFSDSNLGTVSVTVGNPVSSSALDRDGDQFPDLLEYALGLSVDFPTSPAARTPFLKNIGGTNYLTLSIPRSSAPADASVIVEFSSDMSHWTPGVVLTNTAFLLEVRDPDTAISHPKRFTRIRAQR